VLLGYALYSLVVRGTPLAIIASVSGIIGGILLLLAGAIRDRRRERQTDRYDEVIR
jgi:membrane associated rhomboid family serine protease